MQRMGMVIGIKPDKIAAYKQLHAAVWPDVLAQIRSSNIRNYTIFLREPENLLFGYWEYHGSDFAADMTKMAQDPRTQAWWQHTDPCQSPLTSRKDGEQWAMMAEVFHTD
ncbi:L-rhamnose mutarotase [Thalassobius sp. MITS945101]|uniref:L-rhamnose mutarotase n=1 Tax=Thalassobius sp. MITS945101 TaxID=3096994 RepID=UPI00399BAD1B